VAAGCLFWPRWAAAGLHIGVGEIVQLDDWSRREQVILALSILLVAVVIYLALRHPDHRRRDHIAALERLSEIALAIASVPGQDLRPLLDRLAGAARQLLRMPMSRVLLLDEDHPSLIRVVHDFGMVSVNPIVQPRTEYQLDESPATDECMRTGKALLMSDSHRDPHGMNRALLDAFGVRAAAITPLRAGGKSIGVLVLADKRPRRISETDRRLIELWGAQAAVSIVNNRLYQQMHEAIRSLRHMQAQRDTIYQMSSAVQGAKTLDEALTRVADLAPTALEVDVCVVCLKPVESDGETRPDVVRIAAITRLPYAFPLSAGMALRCAPLARAMTKRRPMALEDASQDADLRALQLPMARSALFIPLMGRAGQSIGALVLLRRGAGTFPEGMIRLAEMFSIRAATSIENARLHDQARRDAEAKATLLHELNHRVKNNLAGLVGLLSMGTPDMPPEVQRWLGRVIERISAMARAHELFSAAGAEVHLRELIDTTLDSVAAVKPGDVSVSVELNDGTERAVLAAEQAVPLAMVIYELAYNALVHGSGETGELRVRATRSDVEVLIEVIDDGGRCAQLVGAAMGGAGVGGGPDMAGRSRPTGGGGGAGGGAGGVGLTLVRGLVSRELHGSFTMRRGADGRTVAAVSLPIHQTPRGGSA
jgi:two-component sensor histidine kinase